MAAMKPSWKRELKEKMLSATMETKRKIEIAQITWEMGEMREEYKAKQEKMEKLEKSLKDVANRKKKVEEISESDTDNTSYEAEEDSSINNTTQTTANSKDTDNSAETTDEERTDAEENAGAICCKESEKEEINFEKTEEKKPKYNWEEEQKIFAGMMKWRCDRRKRMEEDLEERRKQDEEWRLKKEKDQKEVEDYLKSLKIE